MMPWDIYASGTFSSFPGAALPITYVVNRTVVPTLTQTSITVPLDDPARPDRYADRQSQLDLRFAKKFAYSSRAGRYVNVQFDLFNALNVAPVLSSVTSFGPTVYQPRTIMQGRLMQWSTRAPTWSFASTRPVASSGCSAAAGVGRRRGALGTRRRRRPLHRPGGSGSRPTSPGIRRATSTSPTATSTRASRSSARHGDWVKSFGEPGTGPGQFSTPHAIAIDNKDNVYVGDRGNRRVQIFDTDGKYLREWTIDVPPDYATRAVNGATPAAGSMNGVGAPNSLCITPGPNQVMFLGESTWPGRIFKVTLDGKVLGVIGESGRNLKQFSGAHGLACPSENEIYVAESSNWRVQKLLLKPTPAQTSSGR